MIQNLIGQRFGRLTVLRCGIPRKTKTVWLCQCSCGVILEIRANALLTRHSKSCGCLHRDRITKHGMWNSKTYHAWRSMRGRCENTQDRQYHRYGERGIRVCKRWLKFKNFLSDMGIAPLGHSLDRINNNGIYKPSNCRWANYLIQNNNNRGNYLVMHRGRQYTVANLARKLSIPRNLLYNRIRSGWNVEQACVTPKLNRSVRMSISTHRDRKWFRKSNP